MKSPTHRDKKIEEQKEALRTLDRLKNDGEVIGTSTMIKAAKAASAKIDENDPIEILGRKIGRSMGFVAVCVLVVYLYVTYVQPMS
ncbi:MAG: hypothetical protein JKX93_13180 [Rhizobiaceae bacterium]|nr:hypothetical protein [Rhizobiaceae bacterium]MBL4696831.1 hypothetical protein [Rhizobiaceae bacterium]